MSDRVDIGGLFVDRVLHQFVEQEALPGSGVEPAAFWAGFVEIVGRFAPVNRDLLARRDQLQKQLDERHPDAAGYEQFLREIGYLVEAPEPFTIDPQHVDAEIAVVAGPQLVVPLLNARFATNAANARWGSLYDALYGTDVIDENDGRERGTGYNPVRGAAVIAAGRAFLDEHFPLASGSHADATAYAVVEGALVVTVDGAAGKLRDGAAFVGFRGEPAAPSAVLLVHHGLHVEIDVDAADPVGRTDAAGVRDIVLESALTTIMDLEDSVAAVDAGDKVLGYRNWLQLMQGRLAEQVTKGGRTFTRTLHPDRVYSGADGAEVVLPGRSLLFLRQVGLLMTTDAVLAADGEEVPENLLDALICTLCSLHDLRDDEHLRNSRAGSMYFVKPKLHGPDEVRFACDVFDAVEDLLGLARYTIKIGIMDEERRTSVNLAACVAQARHRVVFINTGFLDRTGDEIHTSMHAGPMVRKAEMKAQPWIAAYEDNNVDVGLAAGFTGRAQIGKGMWAAPDSLAEMLEQKIAHPRAGASCAWVPSPTAATLHAIHYHRVDVAQRQAELTGRAPAVLADLLTVPLLVDRDLPAEAIAHEVDNNLQGVLGYVVRWIDQGVGCSKVPDLAGTPLMEDRATCRISSQLVANWLTHGIVDVEQVEQSLRRMAAVVDSQNAGDADYVPMAPGFDGPAFSAARALVLQGADQPSGYTEPLLHQYRRTVKSASERETS